MSSPRAFGFLVMAGAAIVLTTVGQLPLVVATHFDGGGAPNGWMGRGGYLAFLAGFGILLPLLLAQLVSRAAAFGNRPAPPAPRARELAYWLACILALTALVVHLLILDAHRASPPRLSTPGIAGLLGFLVAATIGWGLAWRRAAGRA